MGYSIYEEMLFREAMNVDLTWLAQVIPMCAQAIETCRAINPNDPDLEHMIAANNIVTSAYELRMSGSRH
jgi:hypothetical protein